MNKIVLFLSVVLLMASCASHKAVMERYEDTYSGVSYDKRSVDSVALVGKMSAAIQIPTRSLSGKHINDGFYFTEFHHFLEAAYPIVDSLAEKTVINKYSLVYKFSGTDSTLAPGAFAAHIDVVPAEDALLWSHPPFSGVIDSGFIYGRGSQDMKSTLISLMEAMEVLLKEGYQPERDIYFCFGHDEEIPTVEGALKIAEWFEAQDIQLAFMVDEGGTIVDGSIAKIPNTFALIGICEKGYVDIKLTVEEAGGHGSLLLGPSAVARLSKAFVKLERRPMRAKLTQAMQLTLKTAAPYLPSRYRFIAANPKFYFPLMRPVLKNIPIANAMIATTFTPTMLSASNLQNVIPHKVTGNINTRIIPGYTREDVKAHVQKVVGKDVGVSYTLGSDPTPIVDIDSEYYKLLVKSIVAVFPGVIPIPYMFLANTDSRYYRGVCDNIILFTPFELTLDDQKRIHGVDERCNIEGLINATHFFIKCIETLGM